MSRVRPTIRCLREDLHLGLPSAQVPLDQLAHPLMDKASEQFADPGTPHDRIRAIDDVVLLKVKIQRWRGAVFTDTPDADVRTWLVAAGIRAGGRGGLARTVATSSSALSSTAASIPVALRALRARLRRTSSTELRATHTASCSVRLHPRPSTTSTQRMDADCRPSRRHRSNWPLRGEAFTG